MRNIVITGGTDGIGKALAMTYLERGDRVIVVGRNAEKGFALLAAARDMNAGERASFIQAELSLVLENKRVIEEIKDRLPALDALVLCARHYRSSRMVTAEGFEDNFALFYLSRFVLSYGLIELLEKADNPIIANVAGPGYNLSAIQWDNLELARDYHGGAALGQGGKLNDLLGVAFAENNKGSRIKYALFHPGIVSTSFSGEYDESTAAHITELKKHGKSIADAVAPIIARMDAPPAEPLSAFVEGERISVEHEAFGKSAARRLYEMTLSLLMERISNGQT
ncbi:SDR family NAD(P)-dependent oxidoreductase [Cohnella sp. AR92]|uniref:SDR family NAD(P)-dependent oxidoreductase n=1 Tax=Cohnella sp. AR92 TaxID=648716 RepID=UPI000F8DCB35|nr:SDR family NAD(P)-dependent oxidoreductase [Cohnella sp. AR92]RUS47012.1 SDR family NAD(P)-dependent oxidoreductase [Cohnella sp. AR92]